MPQFVTSDSILKIAFAVELNNGTVFSSVIIENSGSQWQLVGYGLKSDSLVTARVPLSVDGNGSITLALVTQAASICTTIDCYNCTSECTCGSPSGKCSVESGPSRQAGYLGNFY